MTASKFSGVIELTDYNPETTVMREVIVAFPDVAPLGCDVGK